VIESRSIFKHQYALFLCCFPFFSPPNFKFTLTSSYSKVYKGKSTNTSHRAYASASTTSNAA
jgi:hypothetical protein